MRKFIHYFFASFLVFPFAYGETQKVLLIETMSVPIVTTHTKSISDALFRIDPAIELNIFNGQGQSGMIEKHLLDQIHCNCFDVLITNATLASKIGKKLLTDTDKPMVFVTVSDPIGAGLIKELDQPTGSFITGRVHSVPRNTKIEIANKLLKGKKVKIGLVATTYPSAVSDIKKLEAIVENYDNIELIKRVVDYSDRSQSDLENMYKNALNMAESIQSDVDFFWSVAGPLSEKSELVSSISKIKPILYGANVNSVKIGALFTVIPDTNSAGEEVAKLVFDILAGENPGEMTVRTAEKNTLAFNLKTATKLGVVIPYDLLNLAGKNIFR